MAEGLIDTTNETPAICFRGEYDAKCVKIYDGDTGNFTFIPPGFDSPRRFRCRLAGYDSAEMNSEDPQQHASAVAARDELSTAILNKIVCLHVVGSDKYGRLLVYVYLDGECINAQMVDRGFAPRKIGVGSSAAQWGRAIHLRNVS